MQTVDVRQLGGIEPCYLRIRRESGIDVPKGIARAPAVRDADKLLGVDRMTARPAPPRALHDLARVDQHAIEIEQKSLAVQPHPMRIRPQRSDRSVVRRMAWMGRVSPPQWHRLRPPGALTAG